MQIKLIYTYEGFVPKEPSIHVCLYLSLEGNLSFGITRSEYNIEEERWEWNKELGATHKGIPPFAYLEVEGDINTILDQLKREGYAVLGE